MKLHETTRDAETIDELTVVVIAADHRWGMKVEID
jgi:hypothetical protein